MILKPLSLYVLTNSSVAVKGNTSELKNLFPTATLNLIGLSLSVLITH